MAKKRTLNPKTEKVNKEVKAPKQVQQEEPEFVAIKTESLKVLISLIKTAVHTKHSFQDIESILQQALQTIKPVDVNPVDTNPVKNDQEVM